jgi:hypothetical protein
MRLATPLVLALTFAMPGSPGPAYAQSIEITSDLAGTQHEGAVLPGAAATLYILARLDGLVALGFTGAELWVSGMPASWSRVAVPNPASVAALGNPFATIPPFRANIAFATCMHPDANGVALLYTVFVNPTGVVQDACLTVQVAVPPTNPSYTTPILVRDCDPPEDTFVAAAGSRFIMNPVRHECTVGLEAVTWGGVKHLYTD